MFCDGCNEGWHTFCCDPPYEQVHAGLFICELCRAKGVTEEQLEAAAERRQQQQQQPRLPDLTALFPDADQRRRDQQARELHGRVCKRVKGAKGVYGRVVFLNPEQRPQYFKVLWSDGEEQEGVTRRVLVGGRSLRLMGEQFQVPSGVNVPVAPAAGV
jgi:hypothetical protein